MPSLFDLLNAVPCPASSFCTVPKDLDSVTVTGLEYPAANLDEQAGIERIWQTTRQLYRTGTQPGIQLCIRREGQTVLNRAIGHARGNGPADPPDAPKIPLTLDTPVGLYSASKAITAMVIHKLDEQHVLRLDDHVCDYIPEFARHGKERITLRHILCHRAGVPNLPPEAFDLDLLGPPVAPARPASQVAAEFQVVAEF